MIFSIIKWVVIAVVLSLVALWIWQGGFWKIAQYAQIIPEPSASVDGIDILSRLSPLPSEGIELWDTPNFFEDTGSGEYGGADYENYEAMQYEETGGTVPQPNQAATGERSQYAGVITLKNGNVLSDSPDTEYLVIEAGNALAGSVNITGWSLQSMTTRFRMTLPAAAQPFRQGVVNQVKPVLLTSGGSVIVTTGMSPIGVSFRENGCTGYLAQTQTFVPALSNSCARPTELLPRSAYNEAQYGLSCIEAVERLAPCTYPIELPRDITYQCRAALVHTFSYAGCTAVYGGDTSRLGPWRLYLALGNEIWKNTHDTIRLLDDRGRTVTTFSY